MVNCLNYQSNKLLQEIFSYILTFENTHSTKILIGVQSSWLIQSVIQYVSYR